VSARAALLACFCALASACGPGGPVVGGARSFDEIDVPTATRSVEQDDARLVQVRDSGSSDPRVAAAVIFGPADPVPDEWLRGARPIVVIAGDVTEARRLAARLLRLGASRVSVVRGGIEGWLGPREPATEPDARIGLSGARGAKPNGREPARRMDSWQQSQK
jgi:rhodanese-related sulfurtransferase